jgi:hypothetical protein
MRPILRGSSPPTNNLHRIPFYLIFSLIMLTILHGASVLKVLILLSLNYALTKATGGTRLAVPATWIFNGCVLLANEWYEGYAFASLHSGFAFLVSLTLFLTSLLIPFYRTPGVGSIRVGTLILTSLCCDSCRLASTTIGLATILAMRMYDILPPRTFMSQFRVITAWRRAKRQEARIRFPPAFYIHLHELPRLRALRAAIHRRTHTHLQRFHVAGAPNYLRSLIPLQMLRFSCPVRKLSSLGRQHDTPSGF